MVEIKMLPLPEIEPWPSGPYPITILTEKWKSDEWQLGHDNAPVHQSSWCDCVWPTL
jgi:hypothetical protein